MRRNLDKYMTPEMVVRLLLKHQDISGQVFEPCVGSGVMAKVLTDHTKISVITNDVDIKTSADFNLSAVGNELWKSIPPVDWVVTNPPFNAATPILEKAWQYCCVGIASVLRITYLEPAKNRDKFLSELAPYISKLIILGQPRPSFTGIGTDSATVIWLVAQKNHSGGTNIIFAPRWGEI